MSWLGELAPYIATALGTGGIAAAWFDYRTKRLVAQLQAQATDRSADQIDRQKLTDDIYRLYHEALTMTETYRKEQMASEREIVGLRKDCEALKERMRIAEQLSADDDVELARLRADNERLEGRLRACEGRWAEFLAVKDREREHGPV